MKGTTSTQLQDIETSELAQAQGFREWLASLRNKKPAEVNKLTEEQIDALRAEYGARERGRTLFMNRGENGVEEPGAPSVGPAFT